MSTPPLLTQAPIPIETPVGRLRDWKKYPKPTDSDPREGRPTDPWIDFWTNQNQVVGQSAVRLNSVALVTQSASVAATDFSGSSLAAGLYEIAIYARITQAAGVSSSVTLAVDWIDGGVTCAFTWPAVTGNTTASVLVGPPITIQIEGGSPIRYTVTYASAGAPAAQYTLALVLTKLNA